jgi:hypothetical protein
MLLSKHHRTTDRIGVAGLFNESYCGVNTLAGASASSCGCVRMVSPMKLMKMIQMLKLMKRNSGLALSTIFGRAIRP